jgi:hypothetical protein
MKVYLRANTRKTMVKRNVVMGITNEQFMKMIDWKEKGFIAKDKILPHTQKEYLEIKKELKEKNLIQ